MFDSYGDVATVVATVFNLLIAFLATMAAFRSAGSARDALRAADRSERNSALRDFAVAETELHVEVNRVESRGVELTRPYKLLLGGGSQLTYHTSAIEEKVQAARGLSSKAPTLSAKEDKLHEVPLDSINSNHVQIARALTQVRAIREDLEREQASVEGQCAANREAEIAKRK
jgi:hypothetical protein